MENKEEIEISIVIPTYNERNRVPKTLGDYLSFFDKSGLKYEIIVADYSVDGSKDLIRDIQKNHQNLILLDILRRGKGLAVFEAFRIARGRYLSFADADNATSPEEFYKIYMSIDGYDAAIGSRGLAKSNVVNYHQSISRRLGSLVLDILFVRGLFGLNLNDTQCGAKIFGREKILQVLPQMRITNSIFDIELLWRFCKIGSINEVPIKWVDDKFSHFRWKDVVNEFVWLLRVRLGL